jgi:hypothetical protein
MDEDVDVLIIPVDNEIEEARYIVPICNNDEELNEFEKNLVLKLRKWVSLVLKAGKEFLPSLEQTIVLLEKK